MPPPASTIVALATPPGRGAIAVVRLSGPDAWRIAASLLDTRESFEARRALVSRVRAAGGAAIDQAVVLPFAAPASYTGEDAVELSLHGSMAVVSQVIRAAVAAGAVLAAPGEFTLRAFLNGRLDLAQAEAVRDLVDAATPLQARVAFDQLTGSLSGRIAALEQALFSLSARLEASIDFPDEGYRFLEAGELLASLDRARAAVEGLLATAARGRVIREGATVAIAGRPNVGKSSLFNRLVGTERAIVHEGPGTTRDLLTETLALGGLRLTLADTAGVRESDNAVEREGVARASQAHAAADLVLLVLDRSEPLTADDRQLLARYGRGKPAQGACREAPDAGDGDAAGAWDGGVTSTVRDRGPGGEAGGPHLVSTPRCLVVVNKADLPAAWEPKETAAPAAASGLRWFLVSCLDGSGVDDLIEAVERELFGRVDGRAGGVDAPGEADIARARGVDAPGEPGIASAGGVAAAGEPGMGAAGARVAAGAGATGMGVAGVVVSNERHVAQLEEARAALAEAAVQLGRDPHTPEEVVLSDLRRAREALEVVTGQRASGALLQEIFSSFCIGK